MQLETLVKSYAVCHISDYPITSGTGFFASLDGKRYLITDNHVMYDRDASKWYSEGFLLTIFNQETEIYTRPLLRLDMTKTQCYRSEDLDLCIVELTEDNITKENGNIEISDLTYFDLASVDIPSRISKDIYFYGMPTSLQIEAPFDAKPLMSKGIISSYDEIEGRFVTDIPVYYGNSGSPAFEITEDGSIVLLGIVQKLVRFNLEWKNRYEYDIKRTDWHNSGYSICRSVNKIIELIKTGYASIL